MKYSLLLVAVALSAQTLEPIAKEFRERPTPPTRAKLEQFLIKHPKDQEGALARLLLYNGDPGPASLEKLRAARSYLKEISDYVDWMIASTEFTARDFKSALEDAERVLEVHESPLAPRAALLALKSARELGEKDKLASLLKKHQKLLSPSQIAFYSSLNAKPEESRRLLAQVLSQSPKSAEASEAVKLLPLSDLSPAERLDRAYKLLDQSDPTAARAELVALLPKLTGPALDLAKVRIGVCDYRLRRDTAQATLQATQVADGEADAERLFYTLLAARRAKSYDAMGSSMEQLNKKYPKSSFRLEALANAAGQFWVMGQNAKSMPLYEACSLDFAARPEARECDWKLAVQSYILRRPDAEARLGNYLAADPTGDHNSAALYFLGRAAEARKDKPAAKTYYQRAIDLFPNHFYAELCRERIAQAGLGTQALSPTVEAQLRDISFPVPQNQLSFDANSNTRRRIARAELLARGALYDYAELELRNDARLHNQAHLLAMAAAQMATRRGAPDQGIRYMKSIFPAYLSLPLNATTLPLWKLAYPLPYKDPLLTYSYKNDLDPYLLAGLIRQESEFSAKVLSRANAHGLTQIMPATGRDLARRLGIKGFSNKMLLDPTVNLQMGSLYLKSLVTSLNGSLEQALASYNAGKGRVTEWLGRGEYSDPAEFIESIPFTETRGYVQSVIRNAGVYRRLYATPSPGLPSENGDSNGTQRRPAK
ncbi:transglycosylase SLT domain-containing protein [Bryobacter aggregatus]|uniref:lytic transglycosylase domain-containing protein n=1 Tax=Bryobacter aggregatus TaxID=360054 RepID=UPI0004E204F5|nr:transglycosylase SLT domain-containing protein [Bryobacter aggregatus]